MADRLAFPSYVALKRAQTTGQDRVSALRPPACCAAVAHRDPVPLHDELDGFAAALAAAAAAGARTPRATFVTSASPGIVAAAMDNRFYPDDGAYLDAVAEALAPEYRRIVEAGHLLQIDAPDLAMERHTRYADRPLADFQRFVAQVVAAINRSVAGLPRERLRLHVCWGNYDGPHHLDVALADILPLLVEAEVGWLVLPFANPRHAHEYRLLDRLEGGAGSPAMGIVAGVVETTQLRGAPRGGRRSPAAGARCRRGCEPGAGGHGLRVRHLRRLRRRCRRGGLGEAALDGGRGRAGAGLNDGGASGREPG